MAAIVDSSKNVAGPFTPSKTILSAADTLVFVPNAGQELVLYNVSASPVVVTIDGANGTTVLVPNSGGLTVSIAAGLAVTVPANGFQVVMLDKVSSYLQGAVEVTGGTGVIACILK